MHDLSVHDEASADARADGHGKERGAAPPRALPKLTERRAVDIVQSGGREVKLLAHQGFPVRSRVVRNGVRQRVDNAPRRRIDHPRRRDGDTLDDVRIARLTHDARNLLNDTRTAVFPRLGRHGAVREEVPVCIRDTVFNGSTSDIDADIHSVPPFYIVFCPYQSTGISASPVPTGEA